MANTYLPITVHSEDITIRDCISLKFHINCCRLAFARSFFLLPSYPLIVLHNHKLVYVIAWARGQLRINFTRIFKVFTKLPESRSDDDNLENLENTSKNNL